MSALNRKSYFFADKTMQRRVLIGYRVTAIGIKADIHKFLF